MAITFFQPTNKTPTTSREPSAVQVTRSLRAAARARRSSSSNVRCLDRADTFGPWAHMDRNSRQPNRHRWRHRCVVLRRHGHAIELDYAIGDRRRDGRRRLLGHADPGLQLRSSDDHALQSWTGGLVASGEITWGMSAFENAKTRASRSPSTRWLRTDASDTTEIYATPGLFGSNDQRSAYGAANDNSLLIDTNAARAQAVAIAFEIDEAASGGGPAVTIIPSAGAQRNRRSSGRYM